MNFFVTGGSRGIGAAIVLQAIREGHDVAFSYLANGERARQVIDQARECRADCRCKAYRMDVRDAAEVDRVGNQITDEFETIDVVVNNAAISRDNLAASMSDEEWHDVIATNLHGPFYVCRHFLIGMLANKFGRIINISSIGECGATGQINYATAKAGLWGMTRSLAKEYGPKNITANLVTLGVVDTEMTREHMPEAVKSVWLKYCPKHRMAALDEISTVVTFLASKGAGFINGAKIPVTGGLEYAP